MNKQEFDQSRIDKDSKTELVDRKIEMYDDGSVLVKETMETTVKMGSRDFISWMRKHEQTRDAIKESLSDDVRKNTEEELKKVEEDIEKLKPFIDECEKRAQAHYEKLKKEGMIKKLQEELMKPMSEINTAYMNQVWANVIENEQDIMAALNEDQKKKFLKIKIRYMQQKRAGKVK